MRSSSAPRRSTRPTELLGQLRALPHGQYVNVQEVWEGLGGKREEGSGHVLQDPDAQ